MPPHQSNNENLDSLTEPLLLLSSQEEEEEEEEEQNNNNDHNNDCNRGRNLDIPVASCDDNNDNDTVDTNNNDNDFCIKQEIYDMLSLGIPLAVSFFCRMGMASTDSAFVGHIHDGIHSPETYLAAAVLSDMVLNLCITPPLAFNQVLNGLVSQAMGSNNPQMAGIWLQQSMFWLCITMLPCLIGLLYVEPILILLGFPTDIAYVAGIYAKYNMIWPIPNGWYQCMRFYFQARGLPKPAMYNNIIFFFINAILNYIFVFGGPSWFISSWKGFGFIGAAISLSISRTMQGVCYYIYMFVYQKHHLQAWPAQGWCWSNTFTKDRTTEFMKQSLPNIGTLLFQAFASQTTTVLVGRLGELSIAASSALSTITIPWSGTLSATCCTVSGVRVGYHLGRGNDYAAKQSSMLVMYFITGMNCIMAIFFLVPYFKNRILTIATDDDYVVSMAKTLIPAMLVSTYLNLLVSNGTSGIFMGQGRPLIATILSFGLELPLSIGGVAIYILCSHKPNLLGVYWWGAIAAGIEIIIVLYLIFKSDWKQCAIDARARQETPPGSGNNNNSSDNNNDDDDDNDEEVGTITITATSTTVSENDFSVSEVEEEEASDDKEEKNDVNDNINSNNTKTNTSVAQVRPQDDISSIGGNKNELLRSSSSSAKVVVKEKIIKHNEEEVALTTTPTSSMPPSSNASTVVDNESTKMEAKPEDETHQHTIENEEATTSTTSTSEEEKVSMTTESGNEASATSERPTKAATTEASGATVQTKKKSKKKKKRRGK